MDISRDPNGAIDWLNEIPNPDNSDFGYNKFYSNIDVIVMGRKTYEEVLGFDVDWPYPDRKCFVVTSDKNLQTPTPNTKLEHNVNQAFIDGIIRESEKNIWLVGGGELIRSFMNLNAVDELILSFISRIIGDGLPLFPSPMRDSTWRLTESEMINEAAVILTYRCLNR
jgi:dihydrofolate reductase